MSDRKTLQLRDQSGRQRGVISLAGTAILFLAAQILGLDPAAGSNAPTETVQDEDGIEIPADLAPHIAPYLRCLSTASNEVPPTLEVRTGARRLFVQDSCSGARDDAREAAISGLSDSNSDIGRDEAASYVENTLGRLDDFFAKLADADEQEMLRAFQGPRFTVPNGMWEYHLCASIALGHEVYLNGQLAEPVFADDPECKQALAHSKIKAIDALIEAEPGLAPELYQAQVDIYITEIDRELSTRGRRH